jgi:GNAT superfamily N-acetyltransferase
VTLDDLFAFFEGPGFGDNPHWRGCYCLAYHVEPGERFDEADASTNRPAKAAQVRAEGGFGLLAYRKREVAGWCNVSPNSSLRALHSPDYGVASDASTATIVCFVVRPEQRRLGVARALLAAAPEYARSLGATQLEAFPYPEPVPGNERLSSESRNYHGFASMYRAAGFQELGRAGRFLRMSLEL